jgi:hypothetical protein
MSSVYKFSNGKLLVISDRENIFQEIEKAGIFPCVVLITAWVKETTQTEFWELIIKRLLESGCTYFVCAGTYAENLHDLVDEVIFSLEKKKTIVTTYHEDESAEDVANFFVNATDISNPENGGMAAILDDATLGDKLLKDSLIRM